MKTGKFTGIVLITLGFVVFHEADTIPATVLGNIGYIISVGLASGGLYKLLVQKYDE